MTPPNSPDAVTSIRSRWEPSRRTLLAAAPLLAGCGARATTSPPPGPPPLQRLSPFLLGVEITRRQADDPKALALVTRNFGQITPGLELKMERILTADGGLDFTGADALLAFAETHGLSIHGHTLIWYTYDPAPFRDLAGRRGEFATAYRRYILEVAGRYRGRLRGWDVVNEPVAEDGDGYRACRWRAELGMDYVLMAFEAAREADPDAVLFLNEYNLESRPRKRAAFLKLVESLLARNAPIGGLGTQMHMDWRQDPREVEIMMTELAAFGLPVHVSELDVSTHVGALDPTPLATRLDRQAELLFTTARSFRSLRPDQRYAFTVWDLTDGDSWLRTPYGENDPSEAPTLFDDQGRPKSAADALAQALEGASRYAPRR